MWPSPFKEEEPALWYKQQINRYMDDIFNMVEHYNRMFNYETHFTDLKNAGSTQVSHWRDANEAASNLGKIVGSLGAIGNWMDSHASHLGDFWKGPAADRFGDVFKTWQQYISDL